MVAAIAAVLLGTPGAAQAYSCVEPDDSAVVEFVEEGGGFMTGRLVEHDEPAGVATFDDVTVWRGELAGPRVALRYSLLYAGDVRPGDRYHVRLDDDGLASACATYLAEGDASTSFIQPWPVLDNYLLAIQSGPAIPVDAEPAQPVEAVEEADDGATSVLPWVLGGAALAGAVLVFLLLRRLRQPGWS